MTKSTKRTDAQLIESAKRMIKPNDFRVGVRQGTDDKGFKFNFRAVIWNDKETGKEYFIGENFIQ